MPLIKIGPTLLKTLRQKSEMSQTELAKAVGVTVNSISAAENGQPSRRALEACAKYFKVTDPLDLLEREPVSAPPSPFREDEGLGELPPEEAAAEERMRQALREKTMVSIAEDPRFKQ